MELAHTAGVTFIQRFDSALRLNIHFHSLFLDGVYVEQQDGSLEFVELAEPTPEQVADVARRTARRIAAAMDKAGRSVDPEMHCDLTDSGPDQLALAQCYAAAARGVDLAGDLVDAEQLRLFGAEKTSSKRKPWAFLLRHVFLVDVTVCTDCGGRMKWLEVATEPHDIRRALARLGLAPRGPPIVAPTRVLLGQLPLPLGFPS